jgi:pimeloyl-ACP methyl ester carboxylesterase
MPNSVRSADGTTIAFERSGDGPPIIVVVGAFNDRSKGAPLAEFLAPDFSVFTYDRRGRGDSGDVLPYAIDREIDDLAAMIDAADGSACVFGYSSGAVLALEAAARGLAITRLALYEPPPAIDAGRPRADHAATLSDMIGAGRRGDAVEYFQREVMGMPADVVAILRDAPSRASLEAMAHTLVYDMTIMGTHALSSGVWTSLTLPTLVISGEASPPVMRAAALAVAAAVPHAEHRSLAAQTHELVPAALGPVLREFFDAETVAGQRSPR